MDNGNRPFSWEAEPVTKPVALLGAYLLLALPLYADDALGSSRWSW
jgi:hypothetical protein